MVQKCLLATRIRTWIGAIVKRRSFPEEMAEDAEKGLRSAVAEESAIRT
jgi:hypothetical protein